MRSNLNLAMTLHVQRLLALIGAIATISAAVAQDSPNRTSTRQPTEQEIRDATRQHRLPANLEQAPVLSTPKFDAKASAAPSTVDLSALAGQLEQRIGQGDPALLVETPTLFVFVTLEMPSPSLKALIAQAERARATLVLRGLKDGSLKKTAEAVQRLLEKHKVAWTIDPEAFSRFAVQVAPSIVLVKPGVALPACKTSACLPQAAYLKVGGDVSLDYALRTMRAQAGDFAGACDFFLKRLG